MNLDWAGNERLPGYVREDYAPCPVCDLENPHPQCKTCGGYGDFPKSVSGLIGHNSDAKASPTVTDIQ